MDKNLWPEMWRSIFEDLLRKGKLTQPRNHACLEVENYQFTGDPLNRFCNFTARNLKLRYLVGELAWYLSGNRDSAVIEKYSKFWKHVKNDQPPFYNSNYGYYIFNLGQFDNCLQQLSQDKDTRQACVVIHNQENNLEKTKDKICTYALSFRIREGKLNMSVSMRSNDLVHGLTVDYFQFSVIQEMMLVSLLEVYPDLELGTYTHKADSLHIYKKHWEMMERIVAGDDFRYVHCPRIADPSEVKQLKTLLPPIAETEINFNHNARYQFLNWCKRQIIQDEQLPRM